MVEKFEPIPLLTHYRGQKIPSQPAFAITRTKEVLKFTSSDKNSFAKLEKNQTVLIIVAVVVVVVVVIVVVVVVNAVVKVNVDVDIDGLVRESLAALPILDTLILFFQQKTVRWKKN